MTTFYNRGVSIYTFLAKKKIVLNQLTALEPAFKCTAITLVWVSKREVK